MMISLISLEKDPEAADLASGVTHLTLKIRIVQEFRIYPSSFRATAGAGACAC